MPNLSEIPTSDHSTFSPHHALSAVVLIVLMLLPVTAFGETSRLRTLGEPCGVGTPILETATLGVTGQGPSGAVINAAQYLGAKFDVTTSSRVVQLGAHLVAWTPPGPIFAAVVPLDPVTDLPLELDLSDASFATSFTPSATSEEVTLCTDFVLEPGRYGLVFGTSLFGATGAAVMPENDSLIGDPDFFRGLPDSDEWVDLPSMSLPVRFFVIAETGAVVTAGLPHFPLSGAQLAALSATELQISNIGSSGLDGVAIGTGQALDWSGRVSDLASPGRLDAAAIAHIDGMPGQLAAEVAVEDDGTGQWELSANFPVSSGGPLAVEVSSGGAPVAQRTLLPGERLTISCFLDGLQVPCWTIRIYLDFFVTSFFCLWDIGFEPFGRSVGGSFVEVTIGAETFTGDQIGVRTIPGPTPGPDVGFTSQIQLRSTGTGSFVLGDEVTRDVRLFEDGFESGDTSEWDASIP